MSLNRHHLLRCICFGLLIAAPAAQAATFNVTKTADTNDGACDADCSLREAISAANGAAGADLVIVPAGTYRLSISGPNELANATGSLNIRTDLTLQGAGANKTIIDGGQIDEVVYVESGANVRISNVSITGGKPPANSSAAGVRSFGNLTIEWSRIIGNTGTGVFANSSATNIVNSTVSGNTNSGVIALGTTSVLNSTVSGNSSTTNGSGIAVWSGTLLLSNSTISGNNSSSLSKGAIAVGPSSAAKTIKVKNSVIAGNAGGDCGATIVSLGGNFFNDAKCGAASSASAMLSPLANYGGTTETMPPMTGSPLIDAAVDCNDALGAAVRADQRRVNRPYPAGGKCDIGAVEVAPPPPQPPAGR